MKNSKEKIEALDLECLKFKLVTSEGWSLEKADHVEKLYKGFLHICALNADIIVIPSKEIDDFWHMHILDTQKYHEECLDIFGKYLHPFPYIGILDDNDPVYVENFKKTNELFNELFNLDISTNWEEHQEKHLIHATKNHNKKS